MKLIRENKEKHRAVYFDGTNYVKVWKNKNPQWIKNHVDLLKVHVPDYVVDHGDNWISYKIVPGIMASTFSHTPEFINRIHNFCINQIEFMKPWCHGDWSLSNILIDGENIHMVDWDNLGQYPEEEVRAKLKKDLTAAFGDAYVF